MHIFKKEKRSINNYELYADAFAKATEIHLSNLLVSHQKDVCISHPVDEENCQRSGENEECK